MSDAASVARGYLECFNSHDWTRMREFLSDDYTYTGPDGKVERGPDAGIAVAQMFATAMPDARIEIKSQTTDGNKAITEFVGAGTQSGELMGISPSNKPVTIPVCNVVEVREGKIVAEREYMDMLNVLQQIGAAPVAATP